MTSSHKYPTALPSARQLLRTSKWQKVMVRWRLPLRYWVRLPFLCLSSKTPPSTPVPLLTCFISAAGSRSWSPVRFNHCLTHGVPSCFGKPGKCGCETNTNQDGAMISRSGRLVPREELRVFEAQNPLMLKIRPLQTINKHLMLPVVQSELLSLYLLDLRWLKCRFKRRH